MGNAFGMKKTTKVMKIDGETFKLKTPVKAGEVLKNHPGLVLLESENVKHYGTRAKPLEPNKDLVPGRLYFLVELPTKNSTTQPRRVRSAINMSAKDRLESLMLTRRSVSDLSILKQKDKNIGNDSDGSSNGSNKNGGGVRVKMMVPRAEVEKSIQGCKDEAEAAEKIMSLYKNGGRESYGGGGSSSGSNNSSGEIIEENNNNGKKMMELLDQQVQRKGDMKAPRQKRKVSFMPISEGGIQIAVAS
ncbi:uncharacterized protein At1g66480-like [Arachis duranensis]|uniref:Uncharacterized protein At1g66480-like n=1 Tax=Arachis duranensis TaxID=130453 RepID=A0A9C6WTJ6_ARADU|nr:uncharacterized protein At1g66480-like [Arachis duranensis]